MVMEKEWEWEEEKGMGLYLMFLAMAMEIMGSDKKVEVKRHLRLIGVPLRIILLGPKTGDLERG